jgi:hypothetical protein
LATRRATGRDGWVELMRITFVLTNPDDASRGRATWKNTALRVRCAEIAAPLGALGPAVKLLLSRKIEERKADGSFFDSDVYVIFQTLEDHRPIVDALLKAGKCVVVDICDDVSGYIGNLVWNWENAQRATAVTVPTQALADRLSPRLAPPVHVIPDAVEGTRSAIRPPRRTGPLRLFWYGWQHKIRALEPRLESIERYSRQTRPIALTVMSNLDPIGGTLDRILGRYGESLSIETRPWSISDFDLAMAETDIAIIPYGEFLASSGRSPVKLIQAIWSGRLAISEDILGYPEFDRFKLLHESLVDGIAWAADHAGQVERNLAQAQEHIAATRQPAAVAAEWHGVLLRIHQSFQTNSDSINRTSPPI